MTVPSFMIIIQVQVSLVVGCSAVVTAGLTPGFVQMMSVWMKRQREKNTVVSTCLLSTVLATF